MTLTASSPGEWGDQLYYEFVADQPTPGPSFGLNIYLKGTDPDPLLVESFAALSSNDADPRSALAVLAAESLYVRAALATPAAVVPDKARTQFETAAVDKNTPLATDGSRQIGSETAKTGLHALDKVDLFNLLCLPPDTFTGDTPPAAYAEAIAYCTARRAFLIVDSPAGWQTSTGELAPRVKNNPRAAKGDLHLSGTVARNAAVYFPRVLQADPAQDDREALFAPCGIVAGLFARTDATRGVWKAPAGVDAGVLGIRKLGVTLTDDRTVC